MNKTLTQTTARMNVAPRLTDAYAVSEAAKAAVPNIALISVFGSVVSDTATVDSDIDLLVVIKDLDCSRRRSLSEEVSRLARRVADFPCDVVIRSVTEWQERKQLVSSFERVIDRIGLLLYENEEAMTATTEQVQRDKMPNSDLFEAAKRLGEVCMSLNGVSQECYPRKSEIEAFATKATASDWETHSDQEKTARIFARSLRYKRLMNHCDRALESALKSLHHSLGGSYPPKTNYLHELLRNLPTSKTKTQVAKMLDPLRIELLPPDFQPEQDENEKDPLLYTDWRQHATYIEEAIDSVYVNTTRSLAYIQSALSVAQVALKTCEEDPYGKSLVSKHPLAHQLRNTINELTDVLASHDLETGANIGSSSSTDVDKLLQMNKSSQTLNLDKTSQRMLRKSKRKQIFIMPTIEPASVLSNRTICGATTRKGTACRHPRPGKGRPCPSGHIAT